MAQVLAPIVQSTNPITMLHSSSDAFQTPTASQPHQKPPRSAQMPRNQMYPTQNGGVGYRSTSTAPIAPYAFSSTPQLRQENRSTSAPNVQPTTTVPARLGHPSHPSSSSDSTVSTSGSSSRSLAGGQVSKDDIALNTDYRRQGAESSLAPVITLTTTIPDLSLSVLDAPVKPSPDRYRRSARRTDSSNSATLASSAPAPASTQQSLLLNASISNLSKPINAPSPGAAESQPPSRPGHNRASSADDMRLPQGLSTDQAKRYRRRSLSGLDVNAMAGTATPLAPAPAAFSAATQRPQDWVPAPTHIRQGSRPDSGHERRGSAGSASSSTSARPSSSRQESTALRAASASTVTPSARSTSEPAKRVIAPSPLSNPISPSGSSAPANTVEPTASTPSPAVQQLTALNDKEVGKGMKSRLRRAFSFGSAAELRRATAENNLSAERAKLRKEQYGSEYDAEQAAIVAKQEAAGIGAGIYSGQGGFSGSTDNLSISSTASSASIMLRKMGHGMKKGGRSIKGLFRPKSVIGVPAADGPITQPSAAQVSMVTVEAERQKVNVNADPRDQVGGGTGYPRLERNSLDASRTTTDLSGSSNATTTEAYSRKSIVGGDRERAEILSSMKKGILKRTGTSSDTSSPVARSTDIPNHNETPKSSAPSTPNDDHARPVQVHVNGEDYFARPPHILNASTRSLPSTPQGSRNISFSPRIQFHDAWSSSDYDRRGDIATCNRLTPMLAQQIKEELNSFKMEMEVHELSKPHTHFF